MSAPTGFTLSPARPQYDAHDERQMREKVQNELNRALKRDETVYPKRLVLTDTVTGQLYEITMASGVLTQTAVTM